MKLVMRIFAGCVLGMLLPAGLASAQMYVFPNKGQSQEQQNKDRGECHAWAVNQTGFDPLAAGKPTPAPQAPKGGAVRGAARGALAGVAIGAIAGDAGKGASIGATTGAFGGAARRRDQYRQMAAEQRALEAEQKAQMANYQRAFAACMEGKGYTVK